MHGIGDLKRGLNGYLEARKGQCIRIQFVTQALASGSSAERTINSSIFWEEDFAYGMLRLDTSNCAM